MVRHLAAYCALGRRAYEEWRLELRRRALVLLVSLLVTFAGVTMLAVWTVLTVYHTRWWPFMPPAVVVGGCAVVYVCNRFLQVPSTGRTQRRQLLEEWAADQAFLQELQNRYVP